MDWKNKFPKEKRYYETENGILYKGDAVEILTQFSNESIDAVITDPPYGLSKHTEKTIRKTMLKWLQGEEDYVPKKKGFMGRAWDGFVPPPALWKEVYRVMKYGATIMVFAGTRTQDLMTMSLRLAGFEIKDTLMWFYGSGFPKGQNIGKQIDKQLGFEREIVGRNPNSRETSGKENTLYESGTVGKTAHITKPASPEAELWEGYSTHSIKPAYEPIIMAMKPNDGNYVSNALKWGVAGLNIKETRIPTDPKKDDMLRTVSRKKRQSETWEKGSGFKNEKNSLTGLTYSHD